MGEKDRALRIGIVGCGGISASHLQGYRNAGGNEIVAVFDPVRAAAERMAEKSGARLADSLEEMADPDVLDAVSVCAPPAAHYETCAPFVEAGIAVLCEKPLGRDEASAEKLAAAAEAGEGLFMTAFCHRFHPPVMELRRLIDSGVLGEPLLFRNIFAGYNMMKGNHRADPALSGGGALIDHCSHSVDLFRHLVGNPTAVQAMAANVLQDLPIEDLGMMQLDVGGKALGEIAGSYSLPVGQSWVEWYGTEGAARISYWNAGQPDFSYSVKGSGEWQAVDLSDQPDRFAAEIAHFLSCVRTGEQPRITAEDGLWANRIVEAVYRSAREGRRVEIESERSQRS